MWTGGAFAIADVPRGAEDHSGEAGWLTVKWTHLSAENHCGTSNVGLDGGVIRLSRETPQCGCNGSKMRPRTVRHELGHAFGFWHTGNASDLMVGQRMKQLRARRTTTYERQVGLRTLTNDLLVQARRKLA
jgi:hypothetical protein